jgi:hypothetical protein
MEFVPPPPASLPPLPLAANNTPWLAEVVTAHEQLISIFNSARHALNLDESDPVKLRFHLDRASTVMVPVIEALVSQSTLPDEHITIPIGSFLCFQIRALIFYRCRHHHTATITSSLF